MPPTMPDPIRATACRRCGTTPTAVGICPSCAARPSKRPVVSAQDLLDNWTAYQHPEGEGYPADHAGWSRLAAEVRKPLWVRVRPVAFGTLATLAVVVLALSWLRLGRAGLAAVGLYPAPQQAQEATR